MLAIEEVTPDLSRMVPIAGGAQITLFRTIGAGAVAPPCGARILLTVRLHPPQRYLDPGVWQYADTLALRGIGVESSADAATLKILDGHGTTWKCRFAAAQHWSVDRLQRLANDPLLNRFPAVFRLSPADTAMLSAMLAGDRTQLDRGLRTAFERTGSFHLFVVAGMHVTLLLAALYWLLLRVRVPRWPAAAISLCLATCYAMLTGFGAPVQRALLMCAVYLLTSLIGRDRNPLNALGAAALAMLIVHPHALFESGFQMTVLVIIAIAGIAIPLGERTVLPYARALRGIGSIRNDPYGSPRLTQFRVSLRWIGEDLAQRPAAPRNQRRRKENLLERLPALFVRGLLWTCELILVTLVAEMVMALPMAVYFHRVTPFAAPANLLALPLVSVLMGFAVVTFLASLLHPLLAAVPAGVTALLLHSITRIVGTLASFRGADVRMPAPWMAVAIAALLLWCAAVCLLRSPSQRTGRIACILVPLALVLILWPERPSLRRNVLEFTAVDVGQGDSILIASPNGKTMLIDAGGPTGSASMTDQVRFDVGEEVVSPYLWSRGIRRLDVLVLTHAHSDHIGGMAAMMRNFAPRELWLSVDADTPPFRALVQLAKERGILVRHLHRGDGLVWSGTQIHVLNPAADYKPRKLPTNDDSLVLRIGYGRSSVLAEGDAEHPSEGGIASEGSGPVTLLKIGHHGSSTSTSDSLLQAMHPQCAVISCGLGNRFGHPRWNVLQRLQAAGVRTSRTDSMGAVQYLLHADGSIETHVLASNP